MTEERQELSDGSALVGERGNTKISDGVVSTIAGIAADQVPGVHMGGGASRNAGGIMESVSGSQPNSRGISVEVGQTETALDLSMAVEYGRDILQAVDAVRSSVKERIEYMTGLKVTELNITINDILSPEKANDNGKQEDSANETVEASGPPTRTMPRSELREGASERESTRVEPTSRTHSESGSGPVPKEPVRAEGEPVGQDETVEIQPGDVEDTDKIPSSESQSTDRTSSSRSQGTYKPSSSGSQSADKPSSSGSQSRSEDRTSDEERKRLEERKRREKQREERKRQNEE